MILKPFSDRFFSYHPVVPWDDWEPLPATQGTLPQHSWSHLSILRVAAGPVGPYGKPRLCDAWPCAPTAKLNFSFLKLFSYFGFSYHPVVPWNDGEALPATQGIDLHIACGLCAGIKPVQGVVIKHF